MIDRRSFLVLGTALSASSLVACDRKTPPAQTPPPKAAEDALRLSVEAARAQVAAKRRYRIGLLFPFQGIPFWVNEAYGVFDQAAKSGIDIVWRSADGYENVDRQVAQIAEMKSLKVDGVLLGATSFAGTRAAVEDLVASGTPVVNHVTSTDSPKVSASVLVDYADIGRKQAQQIKRALPSGGEVLMLTGPAGAEWSTNETNGFKAEIGTNSPWRLVAERNSNPDRVEAQRIMEDLLVRFPKAQACFSVTDSLAMGAIDALGETRAKTAVVTTAGFSEETVAPLKAGRITVNVDESPVLIGRAAVNAMVRVLNGDTVARRQFVPTPAHTPESVSKGIDPDQWAPAKWRMP